MHNMLLVSMHIWSNFNRVITHYVAISQSIVNPKHGGLKPCFGCRGEDELTDAGFYSPLIFNKLALKNTKI